MAEDDVNPKQINNVEILDPESRMFKAWGSVEVRDRENDLLPMDEFRKIMPVIIKRGGILMDRHSNRQVGKILNYEFKEKETDEGMREGVMITGEIFKDYEHDDMVWQGIKEGVYKGLSFGGRNQMKDVKFDKNGLTNILSKLEGFEFSLVPGMGNQEATMEEINYLAKSNKFINNRDVDKSMLNQIEKIEDELNILKSKVFLTEETKTEKGLSLSQNSNKSEKYIKENDLNKDMEETETNQVLKNSESIERIEKKLDLLLSKGEDEDEDEPEEEVEKDKMKKDEKPEEEGDDHDHEDEDLEKDGEKKVQLPQVPEEETGGGEPADDEEDDKVKFVEKSEFDEVKKELASLVNKGATTPRPSIIKKAQSLAPKDQRDIAKLIQEIR